MCFLHECFLHAYAVVLHSCKTLTPEVLLDSKRESWRKGLSQRSFRSREADESSRLLLHFAFAQLRLQTTSFQVTIWCELRFGNDITATSAVTHGQLSDRCERVVDCWCSHTCAVAASSTDSAGPVYRDQAQLISTQFFIGSSRRCASQRSSVVNREQPKFLDSNRCWTPKFKESTSCIARTSNNTILS